MHLDKELAELQDALATVDLMSRPRRSNPDILELLLKKLLPIKIKMDGNKNRNRPHVHIEYHREFHAASYAIDTAERLVGTLHNKYDREVRQWIEKNRLKLLQVRELTQAGQNAEALVCELREQ